MNFARRRRAFFSGGFCGYGLSCPYPLQQYAGRFVAGVLGDELAGEGLFEDGLAQAVGTANTFFNFL
jgi:hypothetical protein